MRLVCGTCRTVYPLTHQGPCRCGGLLQVHLPPLGLTPDALPDRADLWRYLPLLPVREEQVVGLGEGGTPLRRMRDVEAGAASYLKDEGRSPTATFKARGMAVAVSMARQLGHERLVVPSAGNAGVALAAYASAAGLEALVLAPEDTPPPLLREIGRRGGLCLLVPGTLDRAGPYVAAAEEAGYVNLATLREPYRVEGKKTMGFEAWEQLGEVPDWILFPTGGGTGIVGLEKAFRELAEWGWTDGVLPRLCAVQSDGCAPLAEMWRSGRDDLPPIGNPRTVAAGLRVPHPAGYRHVLAAVRRTRGLIVSVPEDQVRTATERLAEREGVDACYEGAVAYLGLRQLVAEGEIGSDETAVLFNTGQRWINEDGPRPDLPLLHRPEDLRDHLSA